jgi:hypothetical protein
MCWGLTASVTMAGVGIAATGISISRRMPTAIPATLGYFTVMELLQASGYVVLDKCGTPSNEIVTLLSVLHIVFQPFFINAFAFELVRQRASGRVQVAVYVACAISSTIMLLQLYPFSWAGSCHIGASMCGSILCTVSGEWHIAWSIPYNGLMFPLENALGTYLAFPTYFLVVFLLPLFYGAWRFVAFHALAGPILASFLTSNPSEVPAVWCLFSIGLIIIALSPRVRRIIAGTGGRDDSQ